MRVGAGLPPCSPRAPYASCPTDLGLEFPCGASLTLVLSLEPLGVEFLPPVISPSCYSSHTRGPGLSSTSRSQPGSQPLPL